MQACSILNTWEWFSAKIQLLWSYTNFKKRDLGLMLGKKIKADFQTGGNGALCK